MKLFYFFQFTYHFNPILVFYLFFEILIKTCLNRYLMIDCYLFYTLIFHLFDFLLFSLFSLINWNLINLYLKLVIILIIFEFDLDSIKIRKDEELCLYLKNYFFVSGCFHFFKWQPLRIFWIKDCQANFSICLFMLNIRKYSN
jgi:hypothetical protein